MKILFAGDIVIRDPSQFYLSDNVKDIIDQHNVRAINFEAPVLDSGHASLQFIKTGPSLSQSSTSAKRVIDAGFNFISIANNHIMDYGKTGLQQTISVFRDNEIPVVGAGFSFSEIYAPHIFIDEEGKKIGILALAQAGCGSYKSDITTCGMAWIHHPQIPYRIKEIKNELDFLIIFCHAGLEDEVIPLPEWQDCYRNLLDMGVDLIIASHPHIIQGYEIYNEKTIFYSLGNFYFDEPSLKDNVEWNRSLMVSIDTQKITLPLHDFFKIIPVSANNFTVDIDDNEQFSKDITERSVFLSNRSHLEKKANALSEKLWKQYYESYYLGLYQTKTINELSLKQIVKHLLKKHLFQIPYKKKSIDETFLLHNIQIESHRWLVERYLYNKNITTNAIRRQE